MPVAPTILVLLVTGKGAIVITLLLPEEVTLLVPIDTDAYVELQGVG